VYADDHLTPWIEALPNVEFFDVHTHTGSNDPDGYRATAAELLDALAVVDARAVVFTTHEPGGYPAANDRVLAEAEASDGRLVPFCRIDPNVDPVAEAERCLARGARGIKLHPRSDEFTLDHPEVERLFALADERRLPVLVHAGRGIPALGRHAFELTGSHPNARLILAHAGISDLSWLWRHADERPNLLYDSSWWTPADFLALFSLVPPGRILLGSDAPYGTPALGLLLGLRSALQAGLDRAQIECIAARQTERLVAGEDLIEAGPAPGQPSRPIDVLLDRIHSYLVIAAARMFTGHQSDEYVGLARLACEVGLDAPQAPVAASVVALLDRFERYSGDHPHGDGVVTPGVQLVIAAALVARTPDVPVPETGDEVDVGEREAGAA
jgi:predicted TIM-barrel fold metal-dependent hydrolase